MKHIEIVDRKWLCQYRNGSSYATNPTTDFTKYPQYNAGDQAKISYTIDVFTIVEADSTIQIKASTDGSSILMEHPFNNWTEDEGIFVGDTVRIEAFSGAAATNTSETVERTQGRYMWITDTAFFATLGTTDGDKRDDYVIKVTTVPDNLQFKFGIIPNNQQNPSFNSLITGEEQAYSVSGINNILNTDVDYLGSDASWLGSTAPFSKDAVVKYISASGTGSYIFQFTFSHIFEWPLYLPDYLSAYQNGLIPEALSGFNSFRYVSAFNFSSNKRNPNTGDFTIDDYMKGSIGFINQNFNGGKVLYNLQSVALDISGTTVEAIDCEQTTSYTVQIDSDTGNFTAGVKAYVYHAKLCNSDEANADNLYSENFILDRHFETDGGGTTSSNIIQNLNVAINGVDATKLDITFDIGYTDTERAFIESGDNYVIVVSVEKAALTAEESDRVSVLVDCGQWVKGNEQTGLISSNQINIYNSAQDPAVATPYTSAQTNVGGLYKVSGTFNLKKDANSSDALLNDFAVGILAYNSTTGDSFWLSKNEFSLGDALSPDVIVNVDGTDYQAINFEGINSIGVPDDDDLNQMILQSTVPGAYSATQAWNFECAVEFPWRDWIYNPDVPTVFYSRDRDTFNNLNNDASNYSKVSGYTIYIAASMNLTYNGFTTEYFLLSDGCDVVEFGDDTFASGWTGDIEYFDENGNQMENGIWMDGDVKVVVTFDNPGALITIADWVGEVMTEPSGGSSRAWRLHSSNDYRADENPLKPIDGQDYLYFYQTAGVPNTLTLEFMIKKEYLVYGRPVNIYPMIKKK